MTKLLIASLLLTGTMSTLSAKYYKCYRYVNDSPTGTWIKVQASSKSKASEKAFKRFKELGGKVTSVNCHFESN